jgi:O-antigen/teichoic acid export membrane protein
MENKKDLHSPQGKMGRRLASGGAWVLLSRLIVAATQVITLGLLARLLSVEDMGAYFIIANFVIIGSTFVQFGLPQVVVKRLAETLEEGHRENVRKILQSALTIAIFFALVSFLVLSLGGGDWVALTVFDSPAMAGVGIWVAFWLVLQAIQRSVGESFRGLHDIKMAALFAGSFSGIVTALILFLVNVGAGSATLEYAMWISVGAISASLCYALFKLHKKVGILGLGNRELYQPLVILAVPIFFASLGNIILTRADVWMLGMFVADQQVALYGAAARIVTILGTPLLIAVAITSPMIAQLNRRGDKESLQKLVQVVPSIISLPSIIVIVIILVAGENLLELIYGDAFYKGAYPVLVTLTIGQILCLLCGVSIQALLMMHQQKTVLVITSICTLLAVSASLAVVDQWGIEGVAVAFASGIALQAILCMVMCRIKLGLNVYFTPFAVLQLKTVLSAMKARGRGRERQGPDR